MYSIIHIESTGANPLTDRITQITLINYDGQRITDTFSTYLAVASPDYSGIHEEAMAAPLPASPSPQFHHIARPVVELTRGNILVAHDVNRVYAFLRHEYRRLGYQFSSRRICTLRISRRCLPRLPSHSLEQISLHFALRPVEETDISAGASLTLALFRKFLALEKQGKLPASIAQEIQEASLPPALSLTDIHKLPEKTGVYFFYGANEVLLYVGKSTNIRKRVQSHFTGMMNAPLERAWKEQVIRVDYEITGSELIALLLESHRIKEKQPLYNRDQRTINYRFGLFHYTNGEGYLCFKTEPLADTSTEPLRVFRSKQEGENFLDRLCKQLHLCQKLCHLDHSSGACFGYHLQTCKGACCGKESSRNYNRRARKMFARYKYPYRNFMILDIGRNTEEYSVVDICDGVYRGFGYVESLRQDISVTELKQCIHPRPEYPDIRQIILAHLQNDSVERVIRY